MFSCNKACSKYHTRSATTPKYTLPQRLVFFGMKQMVENLPSSRTSISVSLNKTSASCNATNPRRTGIGADYLSNRLLTGTSKTKWQLKATEKKKRIIWPFLTSKWAKSSVSLIYLIYFLLIRVQFYFIFTFLFDPSWSDPDWRSELIRFEFCTCLLYNLIFQLTWSHYNST